MTVQANVLVVDDEESIRGILKESLSFMGCEVTLAANVEEALEQLQSRPFNLVMTDIRMPGLSGIELLQQIKKMKLGAEVIIMTSHASLESSLKAIRLGAYDYLLKPFDELEYVEMVVARALDKQQLTRENQLLVLDLKQKNEELVKATQRAARILAESGGFNRIGREILLSKNREDLANRLVEGLYKFSKGQPCLVWFYVPEEGDLVVQKMMGIKQVEIPPIRLTDELIRSPEQRAAWLLQKEYQPQLFRSLDVIKAISVIDTPMVFQGEGYGLFVLVNRRVEDLAAHEGDFLENLGLVAAATLKAMDRSPSEAPSQTEASSKGVVEPNRVSPLCPFDYFAETLGIEVARSRRYRHKFTVILAQIHLQATDVEESGLSIALQELGYRFYKRIRITDIGAR
ncbi:MAG TPA: response regulator, partial [Candidatus Manganitrophaceae bacterium]|nr:response regulator [Candidatus Manganitrophaceae bacterium]